MRSGKRPNPAAVSAQVATNQTLVHLRFLAPIYSQRKRAGETKHVKERNDKEGLRIGGMETHCVKTPHDDSGGNPDDRN